jgi:hypothetical protein
MNRAIGDFGVARIVCDHADRRALPVQLALEEYDRYKKLIYMQGITPNPNFGGMPRDEVQRNIACSVKHCMPELKSWPSATLAEPKELALTAA